MWQQEAAQEFFDNSEKCCLDSATGDSGFLSCSNSALNSCSSEFDSNSMDSMSAPDKSVKNAKTIDFGLSDSFNQLSLKQVPLNSLHSNKESLELKSETITSSDSGIISMTQNSGKDEDSQEHWQLYYTQNEDGDTLLHGAIIQGLLEASLSLINIAPHSCLLNIMNDDAQTALHLAVITKEPEIVRKLVVAGADLSIRNHQGNTALHLACSYGDLACVKALTEPVTDIERKWSSRKRPSVPQNLEQSNYNGETCLHIAASKGHLDIVKVLLHAGADLEAREFLAGRTALHLALENGCMNVVLFLIHECRPNLDAATYAGYTAYDIASCIDEQLARELVRYGATPPQQIVFQENSVTEYTQSFPQVFATACGV